MNGTSVARKVEKHADDRKLAPTPDRRAGDMTDTVNSGLRPHVLPDRRGLRSSGSEEPDDEPTARAHRPSSAYQRVSDLFATLATASEGGLPPVRGSTLPLTSSVFERTRTLTYTTEAAAGLAAAATAAEERQASTGKDAHITRLISDKYAAQRRIGELEEALVAVVEEVSEGSGVVPARRLAQLTAVLARTGAGEARRTAAGVGASDDARGYMASIDAGEEANEAPRVLDSWDSDGGGGGTAAASAAVPELPVLHGSPRSADVSTATSCNAHGDSPLHMRDRQQQQQQQQRLRLGGGDGVGYKKKGGSAEQISAWNAELVSTIEKLKHTLITVESNGKAQLVLLQNELAAIKARAAALQRENESLKERVADDVLRQRQTNRIEMAMEKARIVARVRAAGQQRLEHMEGVCMEAHDDVYYTQRWDAALSPQRDVSFVFHYVSGMTFPPTGSEELVFTVYQQVLYTTARQHGGYLAASLRGMEVFAFQSPAVALHFAKDCHEHMTSLAWPQRAESVPAFSTIADCGRVLFRGPRMHTCVYACNPEVEVNPVTGRSLFFGPDVRSGIEAALELSPVGEIIVNDTWARLFCRAHRLQTDSAEPVRGDLADVRSALGSTWDVVGMPGTRGIICSCLPMGLKGRRGMQPGLLSPTPKYPQLAAPGEVAGAGDSAAAMTNALVRLMKGVAVGVGGSASPSGCVGVRTARAQGQPPYAYGEGGVACGGGGGGAEAAVGADGVPDVNMMDAGAGTSSAARTLQFYSLKQEKENVVALYRKVEAICASLERNAMQSEDRFEISRRKLLDPSETVFVCTVDIGDDETWKRILVAGMSAEEYDVLRNTLRSYVHVAAKHYYGFLMNGNYADVFTYVFREVEQALAFVAEVYIQVNRTGTKYAYATRGTGQEVFLMRAGISSGSMSTIYRNVENGVLKCTGPVIRLSGTLCDLAQNGEILAMEEIIRTFHAKNENLLDTQYNIVKQRGQFLTGFDAPAVVHSILPKPFAYRRPKLVNMEPGERSAATTSSRSAKAALMLQARQYPRAKVEGLLAQQLARMQGAEEARMLAEDAYERAKDVSAPQVSLRNPWILTTRATASADHVDHAEQQRAALPMGSLVMNSPADGAAPTTPALAFLYCDMVGSTVLAAELEAVGAAPRLAKDVQAHFNSIVQGVFLELGGYVAKTNGKCAYVVCFDSPLRGLEAGVLLQQRLLSAQWPAELKTLPSTLFVRDTTTSTVLFHGPRAQVALHLSNRFEWRRVGGEAGAGGGASSSAHTYATHGSGASTSGGGAQAFTHSGGSVDVYGPALEVVAALGRHSYGGEIRVSNALLEAVGRGSRGGKLLLAQLAMEVVPTPPVLISPRVGHAGGASRRPRQGPPAHAEGGRGDGGRERARGGSMGTEAAVAVPRPMYSGVPEDVVCVAAVPRRLEGRLRLLRRRGGAGVSVPGVDREGSTTTTTTTTTTATPLAAGTTSTAAAIATGSVSVGETVASPLASVASLSAEAGLGGGGVSDGARREGEGLTADEGVPTPPPARSTAGMWCVEVAGALEPLPRAATGPWAMPATAGQSSACPEAEAIQRTAETLLELYRQLPKQQPDSPMRARGSVGPSVPGVPSPPPRGTSTVQSSGAGGRGNKGGEGVVLPSSASRTPVPSGASTSPTATSTPPPAGESAAQAYYNVFMRFSKELLTCYVGALRVGNERAKPPPLPQTPTDLLLVATGTADGPGAAAGAGEAVLPTPPTTRGGSSFVPRPPLSGAPPATSVKRGGAATPMGASEEPRGHPAGGSKGGGKGKAIDPYHSALDYLDEACRTLAIQMGTVLGKLTPIPTAPPLPKAKAAFPAARNANKRF